MFDYNHCFCSREWIWTAITRSIVLNNVFVFRYATGIKDELNYNLILAYFQRKVSGHKAQDRAAKREIRKDNYIHKQWLMDNTSKSCSCCGWHFYFKFDKGNVWGNISAQRSDNSSDHNL